MDFLVQEWNKQSEGYFKKDMKNSLWVNWYANKIKREIGHYINNKEDGEWIFMSENGEKILAGFFIKVKKYKLGLIGIQNV